MVWTAEKAANFLAGHWDNPNSPIAYAGIGKIYTFFERALSKEKIEKILSGFESYSVMREEHGSKNRKYQGFSQPTHLWNCCESDSFSVEELAEANDGVKHILCVINTFSKRAYVYPLLDRSGRSGLEAIKNIFSFAGTWPDAIVSDAGGETSCGEIVRYLKTQNVESIIARGINKVISLFKVRPLPGC